MSALASLPPRSRWIIRHVVQSTGLTEAEAEQGILALD